MLAPASWPRHLHGCLVACPAHGSLINVLDPWLCRDPPHVRLMMHMTELPLTGISLLGWLAGRRGHEPPLAPAAKQGCPCCCSTSAPSTSC